MENSFANLREALVNSLLPGNLDPKLCALDDQIFWGRSPVRLDLVGGWTDTPPYCLQKGGLVLNMAVELNGLAPLQVFARPLKAYRIVLNSIDLGLRREIVHFDDLQKYNRIGDAFSIPLAALVLSGFGPVFSVNASSSLKKQLEAFGSGIELTFLAAVPKGSGLGTSSILGATILGTLGEFCGHHWGLPEVAYRTLVLEQMLTTGGGWQDQYGGIIPGMKLLESAPGILQRPKIMPLENGPLFEAENGEAVLLYYTGFTRVAKGILGEIVNRMFRKDPEQEGILSEMKDLAWETREAINAGDYLRTARCISLSWELNQRIDSSTNPPPIQAILERIDDYLLGAKLLGAGGGGYLLMFAKNGEAAGRIKQILEREPPNHSARFVDFSLSKAGFQLARS